MKKLVLFSLIMSAPAFGWDFNSLWKPVAETVSNSWQSMSPAMQKVTIAAGVAATVYAAWPLSRQKAYEQAERCAKVYRDKIDSAKLSDEQIEELTKKQKNVVGVFRYGFFWRPLDKYTVDVNMTEISSLTTKSRLCFTVNIFHRKDCESLVYSKSNPAEREQHWSKYATPNFFNSIEQIKDELN